MLLRGMLLSMVGAVVLAATPSSSSSSSHPHQSTASSSSSPTTASPLHLSGHNTTETDAASVEAETTLGSKRSPPTPTIKQYKKNSTKKYRKKKHSKPQTMYFNAYEFYGEIINQICQDDDNNMNLIGQDMMVKKSRSLAFLPVTRCREDLNPCPYDSYNLPMNLTVQSNRTRTEVIAVGQRQSEGETKVTGYLEVVYTEDEKCLCVSNSARPEGFTKSETPFTGPLPHVVSVTHIAVKGGQRTPMTCNGRQDHE